MIGEYYSNKLTNNVLCSSYIYVSVCFLHFLFIIVNA